MSFQRNKQIIFSMATTLRGEDVLNHSDFRSTQNYRAGDMEYIEAIRVVKFMLWAIWGDLSAGDLAVVAARFVCAMESAGRRMLKVFNGELVQLSNTEAILRVVVALRRENPLFLRRASKPALDIVFRMEGFYYSTRPTTTVNALMDDPGWAFSFIDTVANGTEFEEMDVDDEEVEIGTGGASESDNMSDFDVAALLGSLDSTPTESLMDEIVDTLN